MGFPGRIEQKKSTALSAWFAVLAVIGLFCWALYSVAATIKRPMPESKPQTGAVKKTVSNVADGFVSDVKQIKDGKMLEPKHRRDTGDSGSSPGQHFSAN